MALKVTTLPVAQAFNNLLQRSSTLKSNVQTVRGALATANTNADVVINIMRHIRTARDEITTAKVVAGLDSYAKAQFNDTTVDIVKEANDVITACNNVLSWIAANFPSGAGGFILKDKIVDGQIEARVFTPTAMAGLITQLDALIATFE